MSSTIANLQAVHHAVIPQAPAPSVTPPRNSVPDSDGDHDGSTPSQPAAVKLGAGSLIDTKA
jgi:hypothetical protein